MRKSWLIFFLFHLAVLFSQQKGKNFYLSDSVVVSEMGEYDRTILDSVLTVYHSVKTDTQRMYCLNYIADNLSDERTWPIYNRILYKCAISESSPAFLKFKAAATQNFGILAFNEGNVQRALNFYRVALTIRKGIQDKAGMAASYNNLGFVYDDMGKKDSAIWFYSQSVKYFKETGDLHGLAFSYNNLGYMSDRRGNIAEALDYYHKALKLREQIGDLLGIAESLGNLGYIFEVQNDLDNALLYYSKSLAIRRKIGEKAGIANSLNNVGLALELKGEKEKALANYLECLSIFESIGDQRGIALENSNLGLIYCDRGDYKKGIACYDKALKLQIETGHREGFSLTLIKKADALLHLNQTALAEKTGQEALAASRQLGFPEGIRKAALLMKQVFEKQKKHKKSLEMFELYILMRDSLNNEQLRKQSVKKQFQYEYEKRSAADSVRNAEEQKVKDAQLSAQTAQIKQEKFRRYSLAVGLLFVVCGLLFVVNRFRITSKQKKIIEQQKVQVDEAFARLHEKNKEVMDSIYYARRIQRALITSERYIEKQLQVLKPVRTK